MLSYVIAGLALGGIYAVTATGLVITYVSSGILNFSFAALAYFIARFYYFLHSQHLWAIVPAAVVSLVLAAPALGVLLWAVLFRYLQRSTGVVKIVATIGLSVALPAIATLIFGNPDIVTSPGLAPLPVHVFQVFGTAVTLDQAIAYFAVVIVLVVGGLVLRFTEAGLSVRAMVDSEAMTSLAGTNPSRVAVTVWAVTTFLAGLMGIVAAPIIGLSGGSSVYLLFIAGAFAAVVAARLRSLPIAVCVGLSMGIVSGLLEWALPLNSPITLAVNQSIPFLFIVVFLVYYALRRSLVAEESTTGGVLDRAIRPNGGDALSATRLEPTTQSAGSRRESLLGLLNPHRAGPLLAVVILGVLISQLKILPGIPGEAAAYAVAFLSFTLVTGMGGMIWVTQITFAGVGAVTVGQLAGVHGWPVIPALLAGAVIAGAMGLAIGALTVRLGDLYVALVTLTFGLLMDNLVFLREPWYGFGAGVTVPRPSIASSTSAFSYFALIVFCILALMIVNLRRSSAGLALSAIRSSPTGSRALGLNVARSKVVLAAAGAAVAGLGGGLLACYSQEAVTSSYATLGGLVWLAVLVTVGARSNTAALLAGASFAFIPAIFVSYLPLGIAALPTVLFGAGAVLVARDPDGVLATYARNLDKLLMLGRRKSSSPGGLSSAEPEQPVTP